MLGGAAPSHIDFFKKRLLGKEKKAATAALRIFRQPGKAKAEIRFEPRLFQGEGG